MPLLELIAKAGIEGAVASLPGGIKANTNAIAETIANNVSKVIIKEHLNDPAYYDQMSRLLQEIIADLKARRLDYASFLKRIADLAKRVHAGHADGTPDVLKKNPALRAIYNNLKGASGATPKLAVREPAPPYAAADDPTLRLAVAIDETVRRVRPDDWRGHQARENEIKRALLPLLQGDAAEVERIFLVVRQQSEY